MTDKPEIPTEEEDVPVNEQVHPTKVPAGEDLEADDEVDDEESEEETH